MQNGTEFWRGEIFEIGFVGGRGLVLESGRGFVMQNGGRDRTLVSTPVPDPEFQNIYRP